MKKVEFKKSSVLKRCFTAVIDTLAMGIVLLLIYSFVLLPIFSKNTSYTAVNEEYRTNLVDTKLYYIDETLGVLYIINDNYDENLTYFYENYDSIENYNKLKEEATSLFSYDEENNKYVEIGTEAEMKNWYANITAETSSKYISTNERIKYLSNEISKYNQILLFLSLIPASALTFLLPSMLGKYGETIGMRLFGLKVISKVNNPKPTKTQILIRYSIFVILEIALSLYLFFLPILLTLIMMILSQNNSSLRDYASKTLVVDGVPGGVITNANKISIEYNMEDEENSNVIENDGNNNKNIEKDEISNAEENSVEEHSDEENLGE